MKISEALNIFEKNLKWRQHTCIKRCRTWESAFMVVGRDDSKPTVDQTHIMCLNLTRVGTVAITAEAMEALSNDPTTNASRSHSPI